jgi:hypothetical protein
MDVSLGATCIFSKLQQKAFSAVFIQKSRVTHFQSNLTKNVDQGKNVNPKQTNKVVVGAWRLEVGAWRASSAIF